MSKSEKEKTDLPLRSHDVDGDDGRRQEEKILCVDILNIFYLRATKPNQDQEAVIRRARRKIKKFVEYIRRLGFTIIGFIDKSISSKEAYVKWVSRRISELNSGRRTCMVNSQLIVGSIFQSLGVTVHYSTIDCDDTIAAFAYHMKGSVLSADCDFFRYYVESTDEKLPPYTVYIISISRAGYSLLNHPGLSPTKRRASRRKILETLPETRDNTYFLSEIPDYVERPREGEEVRVMFERGCGSNLTQEPSPHLLARPLRQALYWRLNCGPVLERLAHWDPVTTRATFLEEVVEPNNTLDQLLDNPLDAFQQIFCDCRRRPEIAEEEWRGHVFSQKSVIAELCAWNNRDDGFLNILGQL